jgi:uncharacterized membrane protein
MLLEIVKYVPVYLGSMLKFIAGPTAGMAMGLSLAETVLFTTLGMMTSVVVFTMFGNSIRNWYLKKYPKANRKIFTKKNRRFITLWKKYGVIGVSVLTPVLFSPIGGTLLITYVGAPKKQVYFYMLLSSIFWSIVLTTAIKIIFT